MMLRMIKEDDQLNINNEEIAKCVESELNITSNERKKIIVTYYILPFSF